VQDQATPGSDIGCVHHWLVDPPKGEVSAAVCNNCGQERDFQSSPPTRFLRRFKTAAP